MTSVLETVKDNNAYILRLLLAVPGCYQKKELQHSLLIASKNGFQECVQILLDGQMDPDHSDTSGNTALKLASETGHYEVIITLIRAGCDVNAGNNSDVTALHSASAYGHERCVAALLESGAKVNVVDSGGNTPLILAAKNCRRSLRAIQRLLTSSKCDLNRQDKDGRSALHYCCHQAIGAELLLAAGANPNIQDKEGNTPLILAATEGFDNIIKCLVTFECDPDIQNVFEKRAIHWLSMKNHRQAIEDIAHAGGDVNVPDDQGNSPLWYAVNHNRPQAVKALLKSNCKPDPPRGSDGIPSGGNPLKTALDKKLFGICKLLVLAGCELSPLYVWIDTVEQERAERANERRVTLWVEERPEDNEISEEQQALESALEWFQDWIHSPHSLRQLCRIFIRRFIGLGVLKKAEQLPIPTCVVDYITLKEVEDHHVDGFLM